MKYLVMFGSEKQERVAVSHLHFQPEFLQPRIEPEAVPYLKEKHTFVTKAGQSGIIQRYPRTNLKYNTTMILIA